jgi:membrane protein implicated in regulation of membrane protease activity
MSAAIDNERTKLTANALDRASTACLAVGILAPLATLLQGLARLPGAGIAVSFTGWLAAAVVLHIGARRALRGLRP